MKLQTAYNQVRSAYPGGPEDLLELRAYIALKNIHDQRSLDIVSRYRSALNAGEYHDTESTVSIKESFRERYEIDPEF